jgi:hypothetical protein
MVSCSVVVAVSTWPVPLSVCTRKEKRAVIRLLWAEGAHGAEIHRRLSAQYRNSALPQRNVYEWIYMFKNGVFNDTIRNSDYIVTNDRMIHEQLIGEDMEGIVRGPI